MALNVLAFTFGIMGKYLILINNIKFIQNYIRYSPC